LLARFLDLLGEKWCALQGLNLQNSGNSLGNPHTASQIDSQTSGLPADLRHVVEAWPGLSQPLKAAVLAIINTTTRKEGQ
jgi:hypothetical protein